MWNLCDILVGGINTKPYFKSHPNPSDILREIFLSARKDEQLFVNKVLLPSHAMSSCVYGMSIYYIPCLYIVCLLAYMVLLLMLSSLSGPSQQ